MPYLKSIQKDDIPEINTTDNIPEINTKILPLHLLKKHTATN
jgi:hypothetical protein